MLLVEKSVVRSNDLEPRTVKKFSTLKGHHAKKLFFLVEVTVNSVFNVYNFISFPPG